MRCQLTWRFTPQWDKVNLSRNKCADKRNCRPYQDYIRVFHEVRRMWLLVTVDSGRHHGDMTLRCWRSLQSFRVSHLLIWSICHQWISSLPAEPQHTRVSKCDRGFSSRHGFWCPKRQMAEGTGTGSFWLHCQGCASMWGRTQGLPCCKGESQTGREGLSPRCEGVLVLVSTAPTHVDIPGHFPHSRNVTLQSSLERELIFALLKQSFWWD